MRYLVLGGSLLVLTICSRTIGAQTQGEDVVVLKDGTVVTGTILEEHPSTGLTITSVDGRRLTYTWDQIEIVTRTRPGPEWTPTYTPGELTFQAGYGFGDGFDFGLGARLGTTLDYGVYVGGLFVYHFGKSYDETRSLYAGAELGYSARSTTGVTVRPYALMGYFRAMAEVKVSSEQASNSEGSFFLGSGLLLQVQSGRMVFGIDGRYTHAPGDGFPGRYREQSCFSHCCMRLPARLCSEERSPRFVFRSGFWYGSVLSPPIGCWYVSWTCTASAMSWKTACKKSSVLWKRRICAWRRSFRPTRGSSTPAMKMKS